MFGLYKALNLNAHENTTFDLSLNFDPKYSTICIESMECKVCDAEYSCNIMKTDYIQELKDVR